MKAEDDLRDVVDAMVLLVEAAGAVIIVIGAVFAFGLFLLVAVRRGNIEDFVKVRFVLGRFLVLGLEFQLAADILRTAVAPSFDELGKLAATAAIRTALNFFLAREIAEDRTKVVER